MAVAKKKKEASEKQPKSAWQWVVLLLKYPAVIGILAGAVPFTADSAVSIGVKHLTQPPPALPQKYIHFQAFMDKALAKSHDDRFQTGSEMIAAIEAIENENNKINLSIVIT